MTEPTEEPRKGLRSIGKQISTNLDSIFGEVDPDKIFSTLERTDDRVVLGISTLERAGGFGFGGGEGVDSAGVPGGGGGGGGGGAGQARPIAILEVTKDGVRIWPVID